MAQDFLLIPRSALTSLELCTNHQCDGLLGLCSVGLSKECPVCWHIADSRASRSRSSCICSRRRVDSTRASTTTSGAAQEMQVGQTVISNTHVQTRFSLLCFSVQDFKTVKVVFCDNLPSAAPSVRRTESAARLLSWQIRHRLQCCCWMVD